MSDALSFSKIKLGSLQGFLCPLPFRNVLDRTKNFIRSARGVSFYGAQSVDSADFAVGTNDTMFNVASSFAVKGLLSCLEDKLSIFRVHHFANHRHIDGALLRTQS